MIRAYLAALFIARREVGWPMSLLDHAKFLSLVKALAVEYQRKTPPKTGH